MGRERVAANLGFIILFTHAKMIISFSSNM